MSVAEERGQPSEDSAVVFEDVGHRHGEQWLVRHLDFAVPRGALFALIGKSGAGKTTTLRVMLGLYPAGEGRAEVLGVPSREIHRTSGLVAAALDPVALHPQLTVAQNLRAHARMHGRPHHRLHEWLDKLDLGQLEKRKASRLSQGESQRVNLARALLLEADLLVLDEPLVHLDPDNATQALDVLVDEVRQRGASIVLSSHHLLHVERSADRLALVHGGRIHLQGELSELLAGRVPWHRILARPRDRALELLRAHPAVADARSGSRPEELRASIEHGAAAAVNRALLEAGMEVSVLAPEEDSLDALFHRTLEDAATTTGAAS